ncbi:MAG: GDP-L-fucose synthase [Deltaproteobacteria bacterium]|nr:GDP-L-fucose synthase [Deltaproteobacteria bacterium]MBW2658434.1 GDP-L-fucose synthase [Deltaproteobacteria bacterium]
MNNSISIYVAGHRGMVGAAIVRQLRAEGYSRIITRTHAELDLTCQAAVHNFFKNEQIDYVVLAAARVGGIHANNVYPADFIYTNLMIQNNVIHEACRRGVEHLLFLGSSCIYPKFAPQPMKEEYLLTGELEPTNEPYAIAKIAGIKMCESYNRQHGTAYRSVMPTNLYGPGDNFHLENSHVIPAMIRKYHLARLAMEGDLAGIRQDEELHGLIPDDIRDAIGGSSAKVILWGTGQARREFLHVDDMAAACTHVMALDQSLFTGGPSFLNIGTGRDQTIAETAAMIKGVVKFEGETLFDSSKPDGTPEKLLDTGRINSLGWSPKITLQDGLLMTYRNYKT